MGQADHRDLGSVVRPTALYIFIAICALLSVPVLVFAVGSLDPDQARALTGLPALWIVTAMVLLGEAWPALRPGRHDAAGATTSIVFTFAVLLYLGLSAAVLLAAAATLVAGLCRRHTWWRAGFNLAQATLGLGAAYGILLLAAEAGTPRSPGCRPGPACSPRRWPASCTWW